MLKLPPALAVTCLALTVAPWRFVSPPLLMVTLSLPSRGVGVDGLVLVLVLVPVPVAVAVAVPVAVAIALDHAACAAHTTTSATGVA